MLSTESQQACPAADPGPLQPLDAQALKAVLSEHRWTRSGCLLHLELFWYYLQIINVIILTCWNNNKATIEFIPWTFVITQYGPSSVMSWKGDGPKRSNMGKLSWTLVTRIGTADFMTTRSGPWGSGDTWWQRWKSHMWRRSRHAQQY